MPLSVPSCTALSWQCLVRIDILMNPVWLQLFNNGQQSFDKPFTLCSQCSSPLLLKSNSDLEHLGLECIGFYFRSPITFFVLHHQRFSRVGISDKDQGSVCKFNTGERDILENSVEHNISDLLNNCRVPFTIVPFTMKFDHIIILQTYHISPVQIVPLAAFQIDFKLSACLYNATP